MATLALPSSHSRSSSSQGHPGAYHAAASSAARHPPSTAAASMAPSSSSSSHASAGTKLRSHLLSLLPLLPKHALFHAKLTLHEVASVPFLDGEFAAKWRFKNAHSVAGAAASAHAHAHAHAGGSTSTPGQSTGSLVERGADRLRRMGSFGSLRPPSAAASEPVLEHAGEEEQAEGDDSPDSSSSSSGPERPRGGRTTPMPGDPPPASHAHQRPLPSPRPQQPQPQPQYSAYLSPAPRPALSAAPSYLQAPPPPPPPQGALNFLPQPKGQTPFVPLRKHAAVWSLDVDAAVQMSIGRPGGGGGGGSGSSEPGTPGFAGSPTTGPGGGGGGAGDREPGWLQPSELKVTVVKYLNEWERKDELAKEGSVLGTVVVNLAEYVGEGLVTRRYLLRDSKTNATLRLSIELTQIGGETRYRAPPLQKGQILGSVAGLMSDDHMRRHARSPLLRAASSGSSSSSLYLPAAQSRSPYPQPQPQGLSPAHPPAAHRRTPSAQSMPAPASASAYLAPPHPTPSYPSPSLTPTPTPTPSAAPYPYPPFPSPAPSPGAHPQSTELIIEALFNPFPTQSTAPSPFTYYKPPPPSPGPRQGGAAAAAADGSEVGDEEGTGGEGSSGTADESARGAPRKWWRSNKTGRAAGKGRPRELDLRAAKQRSETELDTPSTAGTAGSAVLSGLSGASTVTPGTARGMGGPATKWKWRTPQC